MEEVAQQTGGKICVNNNDLADCVKTAVTEGSSYLRNRLSSRCLRLARRVP